VENEVEQATVRMILDMKRAGASINEIARRLNRDGIPTKKGGKWYASTVSNILRNSLHGKEAA
jgi:site-specific DNA recombinase